MSAGPGERKVAEARQTLEQLGKQADEVRAQLAGLQQNLADAQREFGSGIGAQLVEANEKLVIAALQAEAVAETAVAKLNRLARAAHHDSLTGTPNRVLMLDRLEHAIALAQRHKTRVAVLFLDLDEFKPINDVLGHAAGDEALQVVARRLESVVRHSDTVSRYGGDEFLVLLAEVSKESDAALIAGKMLNALAAPEDICNQEVSFSASIGIAIYPDDGADARTLIGRADAAMYDAKKKGHGNFGFSKDVASAPIPPHPDLDQSAIRRLRKEQLEQLEQLAHDESRLCDLREANEQLVLAVLASKDLEMHAAEARRRQIEFLAKVADELHQPLTAQRIQALTDLLKSASVEDTAPNQRPH